MLLKNIQFYLGFSLTIPCVLICKEIVMLDTLGKSYSLAIDSTEQFDCVIDKLVNYVGHDEQLDAPISLNLIINKQEIVINPQKSVRNYHIKTSSKEKKDIEFLVTNMAWEKNLKRLWDLESEMNKAGERIMNLHPFKFLETICTDDRMCAGLKAIRERNILIWPRFVKGSVTSLKEEHALNNVLPYVKEFAETIGVDVNLIMPLAISEKWEELVKTVADKVERKKNPNRYNM